MTSIVDIDERTLSSFRWPSYQEPDGNYTNCRYLADYILKDRNGKWLDDMFVKRTKENRSYIAEGTLLARPGSNEVSVCNVEVPFIAYSIDFSENGSAQRGYWMESNIEGRRVFYKLVRPHMNYRVQSQNMEVKLDKFLELYDYLAKLRHLFNKFGFIECSQTIQELHAASNGAFDLNFVKENGIMVLMNLVNSLHELKSILLIDSIRDIGNLDRKAVFNIFPNVTQKSLMKALAESKSKRKASPLKTPSIPVHTQSTSAENEVVAAVATAETVIPIDGVEVPKKKRGRKSLLEVGLMKSMRDMEHALILKTEAGLEGSNYDVNVAEAMSSVDGKGAKKKK